MDKNLNNFDNKKKKARVIAFYLPQFHPIPENDEWWGKGFTEWTNVGKAKPLFKGHYQPRVPADLGYYDLRLSEVREEQAKMANHAGIEGFCYWHYWFAGKRLIERPFEEVLKSKKPNFPFCLAWANETWSGIWHGKPGEVLLEQTYPGIKDYENHFYNNLEAFHDERYIKVDGKPLFYIYRPLDIPNTSEFFDCWNNLAIKNGLKGIHFVGQVADKNQAKLVQCLGYDAIHTYWLKDALIKENLSHLLWNKISEKLFKSKFTIPKWDFEKLSKRLVNKFDKAKNVYPNILSGWDNSPRSGIRGRIFVNYSPNTFEKHVVQVIDNVKEKEYDNNIVFMRAWNEWAEGNYVEPDMKYGRQYLDILKNNIIK